LLLDATVFKASKSLLFSGSRGLPISHRLRPLAGPVIPASIHWALNLDSCSLSQLDTKAPRVLRFNMPFDLGLAVAQSVGNRRETWYVCETVPHAVGKSLSESEWDRIHGGTVRGVFGALCDIFVRKTRQPSVQEMHRIYRPETESAHDNEASWR